MEILGENDLAEPESIALSFILSLRNAEHELAQLVAQCQSLAAELDPAWPKPAGSDSPEADKSKLAYEILVLDAGSTDNSESVIDLLHARVPELRSTRELEPARAIAVATRSARGARWLIADRMFSVGDARWALAQLASGRRVASVASELIAIEAEIGRPLLAWLRGGLATAQLRINDYFRVPQRRPEIAWRKPKSWGARRKVAQALRSRLGRVGLGRLDRPRRGR